MLWALSATVLLGLGASVWFGQTAGAAPAITASFTVNGHAVAHSGNLKLDPGKPANLGITVTNNGSNPVLVDTVALVGKALDITFFDFETETGLTVAPGATVSQQYSLSLAPLSGQGDGLIPASIELLDANRHVLVSDGFTADVQGKITSLFGLFAIEITIFTALLFAGAVLALSRGTLHENRFRRGLRFMWPGLGLGLVIVFAFSILRVFAPSAGHWLPVVLICTIAGFAVGYLTPNPPEDEPVAGPDVTEPVSVGSPAVDPRATLPVSES